MGMAGTVPRTPGGPKKYERCISTRAIWASAGHSADESAIFYKRYGKTTEVELSRTSEGIGVGLRHEFFEELIDTKRRLDWVEIIPENWMGIGGRTGGLLARYAERWVL